ncbi:MAG TPA: phage tail sheath C-terminal domain-containing protein [Verrucomicrobiae bacterium]|nr:phage tail sheath C-terminal domain-containing protein [Verrucomicrobiae bacterium]
MPAAISYPGVYIEEIPSGVRTITGVPTSITAFVGRAWKGPMDEPVKINSAADYERTFGGLWRASTMSYAVRQFFSNGGSQALIVRVADRSGGDAAVAAEIDLGGGTVLHAASFGTWGRNLIVTVDHHTKDENSVTPPPDTNLFNLTIFDDPAKFLDSTKQGGSGARETFLNVSRDANSARFVGKILAEQSSLVRVATVGSARPAAAAVPATATSGHDGVSATAQNVAAAEVEGSETDKTGIYALLKADIFNLLCIPPLTIVTAPSTVPNTVVDVPIASTWEKASKLCEERRALLIVDAPRSWTLNSASADYPAKKVGDFSAIVRKNAALYFPTVRIPDPLQEGGLDDFAPCGIVAGVMSRTDAERGIWKAPAGIDASMRGVVGTSVLGVPVAMNDKENGDFNPLGINCLRSFPNVGHVVWGARTLEGADVLASDWKYVPVRRLTLFLEESLYRGTQWVVFEPNDEPLWAQIRLNLGAFMQTLFRQGAFQGKTPQEAYFVKCDRETTTQDDINRGVVNIVIGFAPFKPAEFVIIKIQQMAGQIEA